jgi:quercetin dioxygenase-like cupin family protein
MPYAICDYRHDIRNLFVTPQLRGRFLRMEPGEVHGRHSHDLGHEVFLILQGRCRMEIDGDAQVLEAGQLCVAFAHQLHQASNPFDEPMVMYLSVTPHIEPTHTQYDTTTWERRPPRYNPPTAFDKADTLAGVPTAELADRHLAAVRALAEVASASAEAQAAGVAALTRAAEAGDPIALKAAMDGLWEHVYATFQATGALGEAWNDLAPRAAQRDA